MNNTIKAIHIFLLALLCMPAYAQFNIKNIRREDIKMAEVERKDSVIPVKGYNWDYVNDAEQLLAKRKRRHDRNLVELETKLSLSQTSYENWATGGDNVFLMMLNGDFKHVYKLDKFNVETKFKTKYGINYIEKQKYKNEDEFVLNVKTNWQIHKNWAFSQESNLRSQYSIGYNNRNDTIKRSAFMSPGYLDLSVGITYKKKPLTILLSPIGGNARFVLDKELSEKGINGVEKGKHSKWQAGPSVRVTFEDKYLKDVLEIKSEAYSFTNLKSDPTLDWRTTIRIWATKFLSTTLYGQVMYDEFANTTKPKTFQYKYSITIDLVYKFKNK